VTAPPLFACVLASNLPAEMQGTTAIPERRRLWKERRVFYCTPQTIDNDLQTGGTTSLHTQLQYCVSLVVVYLLHIQQHAA
jgi:ERCC4-related helicase